MAYNRINQTAHYKRIIEVYNSIKQSDIPDTRIVKHQFPKYGIFISYRTWCKIKGMKPSDLKTNSEND